MLKSEEPASLIPETALLSKSALSDWLYLEEDAAWAYLQQANNDEP